MTLRGAMEAVHRYERATSTPIVECWCGWRGPATLAHCERCTAERGDIQGRGRHHGEDYKHSDQCVVRGCLKKALVYQGRTGLHCRDHSVEDGDRIEPRDRNGRFLDGTADLAALLAQDAPVVEIYQTPRLDDDATYFEVHTDREETVHRVDWMACHAWCTCIGFIKWRHCSHADVVEEKHRSE